MSTYECLSATVATVKLINSCRDMSGDLFTRLHTILCLTHSLDRTGGVVFDSLIDTGLIAAYLDKINQGEEDIDPWKLTDD